MRHRSAVLRGFLQQKDKKDRFVFVYNSDPFTKSFLTSYFPNQNTPLYYDGFYAKYTNRTEAFTDKTKQTNCSIFELFGKHVEVEATIYHYFFKSGQKNVSGWTITIEKIIGL